LSYVRQQIELAVPDLEHRNRHVTPVVTSFDIQEQTAGNNPIFLRQFAETLPVQARDGAQIG
jgi:hypothetical protein